MSRRVFLHVGTPKSGTTYLQAVLWQNADQLKSDGLLLPGRFQAHYAAAKGVTSRRGMRRQVAVDMDKAWSRLARQVNDWQHDALISHELLAPATSEQAANVRDTLNGEIHLVLTARALDKQVPASWQEQVKGGLATAYDDFLRRVHSGSAKGAWFWEVQDLVDIARRWAQGLPATQVHVVTVPKDSTDSSLLWSRYAAVLGLQPEAYDTAVPRRNVSLGVVESELLRELHARRDYRFRDPNRHAWTRKLLAAEILARHSSAPIATPPRAQEWIQQRSTSMLEALRRARYNVEGDLEDLRSSPPPVGARLVSSVTADELADAAEWAIEQLRTVMATRYPQVATPAVTSDDRIEQILDLLEHIRAADTGADPRPAPVSQALRQPFTKRDLKTEATHLKRQ